jgi:hypothetical protein
VSPSRPAEAASRTTTRVGAALILSVLALTPARAGSVTNSGCVGLWANYNCAQVSAEGGNPYVRLVPEPLGENERGQLAARDRRWVDHCRPVVQYDRYGVPRYRYSAAGCEFGVGAGAD